MQLTDHAIARSQQRGIPKDYIDMIMEYGTPIRKQGNAYEYKLHKKTKAEIIGKLKRLINLVDRCSNKAVLVDSDHSTVITVYNLQ